MKHIFTIESDENKNFWTWSLVDQNQNPIAQSIDNYADKAEIIKSIKHLIQNAKDDAISIIDKKIEQGKELVGYNIIYDNEQKNWVLMSSNKVIAKIFNFPDDKDKQEQFIHFLKDADVKFKNPEDDPAYTPKQEDNTKPIGIAGS